MKTIPDVYQLDMWTRQFSETGQTGVYAATPSACLASVYIS